MGQAVVDSKVPRDTIFITTKLWLANWGYQESKNAVKESLAQLQTTYIDLLLLHAPGPVDVRIRMYMFIYRQIYIYNFYVCMFVCPNVTHAYMEISYTYKDCYFVFRYVKYF